MAYNLETAQAQLANLVQGAYTEQDLLDLVWQIDITAEDDLTTRTVRRIFCFAEKETIGFPTKIIGLMSLQNRINEHPLALC